VERVGSRITDKSNKLISQSSFITTEGSRTQIMSELSVLLENIQKYGHGFFLTAEDVSLLITSNV